MKRWHWMSFAFLAVALVRLWFYARRRGAWCLGLLLTSTAFGNVTVIVLNPSLYADYYGGNERVNEQFNYGACPGTLSSVQSATVISRTGSWAAGSMTYVLTCSWGAGGDCYETSGQCHWTKYEVNLSDGSGTTNYTTGWTGQMCDGETYTLTVNGPAPCYTNIWFSVKNADAVSHTYYQALTAADKGMSGVLELAPGASGLSVCRWPCDQGASVFLFVATGFYVTSGDDVNGTGNGVGGGGGIPTGTQPYGMPDGVPPTSLPTTPVSEPPMTSYNPTNASQSGTNSPILWTAPAATNAALAAQQGFGALYDATVKIGDQAHADAGAILQGVNGMYTNADALAIANAQWSSNMTFSMLQQMAANTAAISNGFKNGITITNGGSFGTNIISLNTSNLATEGTLEGISNMLGAWFGDTNGYGTNSGGGTDTNWAIGPTNFEYDGYTNYAGALAGSSGSADLNAVETWYGTMISSVVQPTVDEGGTPGGSMMLTFPQTGYVMDFNPLNNPDIYNIFYYAKLLIQWLLCIYYVNRCLVDARWAISVCNQTHGTMNPASVRQKS